MLSVHGDNQPDKKNVDLFRVGTHGACFLASLARLPCRKREVAGIDYSTGAKAGRALVHGAADVAIFGLWEVVGTPAEAIFSGDEMAYEVLYDQNNKMDEVTTLKK